MALLTGMLASNCCQLCAYMIDNAHAITSILADDQSPTQLSSHSSAHIPHDIEDLQAVTGSHAAVA